MVSVSALLKNKLMMKSKRRSILIGCEMIVLNQNETDKQDLIQDFISIITSFCARIYGQRRSKRKTEQLIKELEHDKKINNKS